MELTIIKNEQDILRDEVHLLTLRLEKKDVEISRLKQSTSKALKKAQGRLQVTIELRKALNENRNLTNEIARLRGFQYQ